MKILAISDQVVETIYSAHICERFGDVGMVIACGDLPYFYLEYIATMLCVPCFFVHGNHDQPEYTSSGELLTGPGGWVNLDERSVKAKGVLLAGLEGSNRYKPNAPFQYTEREMDFKIWKLTPTLLMNRMLYGRYVDILVTHSPPFGIHDGTDLAHRGFHALIRFMARFRPRYLLHGHKHVYRPASSRTLYWDTEVINVYPAQTIEW